jgi:hypothetical protein
LLENIKPLTCRPDSVIHLPIRDLLFAKAGDEITLICWADAGTSAACLGLGCTMMKHWERHSIHAHAIFEPIPKFAFLTSPHFFIRSEPLRKAESSETSIVTEPG